MVCGRWARKKLTNQTLRQRREIQRSGAELIRLWAASADYREDIRVSDEILKQTSDSFRQLRCTGSFCSVTWRFEPAERRLDRWLELARRRRAR